MNVIVRNIVVWWLTILTSLDAILQQFRKFVKIRRWWVKPHLEANLREMYGAHSIIFSYFHLRDHEEFRYFVGMSVDQFFLITILKIKCLLNCLM